MFQDEARFGRMVRIRRCWSPAPQRPVVDNGYERQFQYVYGAVSPLEGELDWMIRPLMNLKDARLALRFCRMLGKARGFISGYLQNRTFLPSPGAATAGL